MRALGLAGIFCAVTAASAHAAVGPDRPLTDPQAIVSAPGPRPPPAPVASLFDAKGSLGATWGGTGENIIVSTNISGRYNLWSFRLDGSTPLQLSQSDDRQTAQTLSPDGRTLVFQSDHGGAERYDLFALSVTGGAAANLTNTPDVSETDPLFSSDGLSLAFNRKLNAEPASNIAIMDLATRKVRVLTKETEPSYTWSLVAWTDGGRQLIANRVNRLRTRASVWRIDVATGKAEELTPSVGDVVTAASDISPDGRYLAVASNRASEQMQAALYDLRTKAFTWLSRTPWEEETSRFAPNGSGLVFVTNADGRSELAVFDMGAKTVRRLQLPPGVNAAVGGEEYSPDSSMILVSHSGSTTPPDYWTCAALTGACRKVTTLAGSALDAAALPASTLVHYRSADGTVISAFVWVPIGLSRNGAAPGVVLPHGGPTGQTTDAFNRTAAALASRGYVVIAPNVRGSTGYGKAFQQLNIKDLGGGDLVDEIYAANFLTATGYVNAKRIGITGGSYGGYMTLMAIGKTPDRWAAAVEEYGIIDWRTMLQHEDAALQAYEKSLLGDPERDAAVYAADSPITFIRKARAPLLVLQGDNDIRVPKEEAEQVVAILKGEGRTVDAHYYPNEGHGFAKRENQIDALERTIAWFDQYLKPAP